MNTTVSASGWISGLIRGDAFTSMTYVIVRGIYVIVRLGSDVVRPSFCVSFLHWNAPNRYDSRMQSQKNGLYDRCERRSKKKQINK
ncbi:hypothetical protein E2C01_076245 [Portunus trituberculatus]|uniref:Uncharacterized protein n=1 Tax=Portunus trituberculatus TaxID=210409 RepID=A0A5B7ILI9_PORTR|nr:hypothetical protein [Portunus trituberculatus]